MWFARENWNLCVEITPYYVNDRACCFVYLPAIALNFLKGQVMKLSRGKANPNLVGEILERRLKS
jgi:hypothetical protein